MVKLRKQSTEGYVAAFLKRLFDLGLSFCLLLLLSPLFILIALGIRLTSPGPILFRQVRMGRRLRPFLILKFRTMRQSAPRDLPTAALNGAAYITPLGRLLRRTSLDELPQLFNILRGDMSFIGPRPVVLCEEGLIVRRMETGVYRLRPGLSGLAQLYGRDRLAPLEKAALDQLYLRYATPIFDLQLLFASILPSLLGRGVCEGGEE